MGIKTATKAKTVSLVQTCFFLKFGIKTYQFLDPDKDILAVEKLNKNYKSIFDFKGLDVINIP